MFFAFHVMGSCKLLCICISVSRQRNFKTRSLHILMANRPSGGLTKILADDFSYHESLENSRLQHGCLSGKHYRIDGSLYEAAVIDGRQNSNRQKIHNKIPSIKPIVIMMFILNIGKYSTLILVLFYQVTQGIPNSLYKVASTFWYLYLPMHCRRMLQSEKLQQPDSSSQLHAASQFYFCKLYCLKDWQWQCDLFSKECWYGKTKKESRLKPIKTDDSLLFLTWYS